jgi:hypothetical protein
MLTFSQYVSPKTFKIGMMTMQSTRKLRGNRTVSFNITSTYNSLANVANSTVISFYMKSIDFALLKLRGTVGASNKTTFMTLKHGAIKSVFKHRC